MEKTLTVANVLVRRLFVQNDQKLIDNLGRHFKITEEDGNTSFPRGEEYSERY